MRKKERKQITNIRNEKGSSYRCQGANKGILEIILYQKLDENNKFLQNHSLSKGKLEKKTINNPIPTKEIRFIIKYLLTDGFWTRMASLVSSVEHLKRK